MAQLTPDDVVARIGRQEVVDLALALGNIDSPTGSEGVAGQFVYDWLERNGFEPKKYALVEERFNVAAWVEGSGGGYNLVFNSHLDTTLRPDAVWSARDPKDPLYHSAWIDGEEICGDGVVNDKGPMAAFLVAAKAIRDAGTAVSHATLSGARPNPGESLTLDQALRAITVNAAHAGFVERRQGTLEPGKLADLVVLAADPTDTDPDAFAQLPVELTIVGGSVVSALQPA